MPPSSPRPVVDEEPEKARDPEMHQTKKGKQWHFGMKAHIGADADSGLVHSVRCTAANVADMTDDAQLLHGEETSPLPTPATPEREKRAELQDREVTLAHRHEARHRSRPWTKAR